ncbi:hypothetical protein ACRJ4W_37480 [Streptomyces sp. GLT-R25]
MQQAKTAQFLALRAKIVLRCAEEGTDQQAAADLGISTAHGHAVVTPRPWPCREKAGLPARRRKTGCIA